MNKTGTKLAGFTNSRRYTPWMSLSAARFSDILRGSYLVFTSNLPHHRICALFTRSIIVLYPFCKVKGNFNLFRRKLHQFRRNLGRFCVQFDLLFSGLPARGLRSAGPDFLAIRNRGKNRQRRGLPPPCGIHPAVLGVPASIYCRPLSRWGHMDGAKHLWEVHTSLAVGTSTARALPWCAAVPSCRWSG